MSTTKHIAGNAAWLMGATVLQKIVAFVSFFFVARWSGPTTTGSYFYAVAITSVFVVLADLGLTPVVIREYAANPERGARFAKTAFCAKAFLVPFAVIAALIYAALRGSDPSIFVAILLACGVMSADACSLLFYGILRGSQQLRFEAMGMFLAQCATAVFAMASAWFLAGNVAALVGALLLGSLCNVCWAWQHVRGVEWREAFWAVSDLKIIAKLAIPFALAGIFVKVYSYIDTLFLEAFWSKADVGHYAIAYKLTYAFQFLPLTFIAALYPGLSAMHARGEKEELRRTIHGSLRLMMLLSIPVAVSLSAFSSLIPIMFGKAYAPAVPILAILSLVLIPIFLDFPVGSLLNATHRAHLKTTSMGIAMVVNVVLNALFVPTYGAIGAAYAALVSFTILGLVGMFLVRHDVGISWMAHFLGRGILAASTIYVVLRFLGQHLPWIPALILGVMSSIVLLGIWHILIKDDVMMVWSWIKRRC